MPSRPAARWHLPKPRHAAPSLPTSAERLVKLDDAQQLAVADLRQRQLRLKQIAIGVKGVELRIHAAAIAYVREPLAVLERGHQLLLFQAAFADRKSVV